MPQRLKERYTEQCCAVLAKINEEKASGRKIIYCDEIVFSKVALQTKEWSVKNTNLTVDQEDVYRGFRTVIASMSEEAGFGLLHVNTEITNQDNFQDFLKDLRRTNKKTPLALFLDQLSVHKTKKVRELMQSLNINPIFNVGYSPEFNPIESVFSKVKFLFARTRLSNLVNKKGFNFDRSVELAFKAVTAAHCAACVRKSKFLLERAA